MKEEVYVKAGEVRPEELLSTEKVVLEERSGNVEE
jgi:hypothetical protein